MAQRERTASNASISKKMASKALGAVRSLSVKRRPSSSSDVDDAFQKPLKDKRASMIDDDGPGSGSDSDSPGKKRSAVRKLTQRFSMSRKRTGDLESGPLEGATAATERTDTGTSPVAIPVMSNVVYQEPVSLPPPDGAVDLGSRPGSPVVTGFQAITQKAVIDTPAKEEVVIDEHAAVIEAPRDVPDPATAVIPDEEAAPDSASVPKVDHEDEPSKLVAEPEDKEDDVPKPPDHAIPDASVSQQDEVERADAHAAVHHHDDAADYAAEAPGYVVEAPLDGDHVYKPLADEERGIHPADLTSSDALVSAPVAPSTPPKHDGTQIALRQMSPPGAFVAGARTSPVASATFWDWMWMPIKVPLVVARAVIVFTSRVLTAPFIALAGASRFVFRRMQPN